MSFLKFPKIKTLRDAQKHAIKYNLREVTYTTTPKMHGTNTGVGILNRDIFCQSRNQLIESEHFGFREFVQAHESYFLERYAELGDCYIYGEWVGPGIHEGVALDELSQHYFVIFKVYLPEQDRWMNDPVAHEPDSRVRSVHEFWEQTRYTVNMFDTKALEGFYDELMQKTLAVEKRCPVAYGLEGIEGIGEGVVATAESDPSLWFKVKGAMHTKSGKGSPESYALTSVIARDGELSFFMAFFNEDRLDQGIARLVEEGLDPKSKSSTRRIIDWAFEEFEGEGLDEYREAGLDEEVIKKNLGKVVGSWFARQCTTK